MKKLFVLVLIAIVGIGISCGRAEKGNKDTMVLIKTELGDIKLRLYDETPEHKMNFIKLVEEGYYDGLLFHRVIKNFMIQGGDENSKNAEPGVRLGGGNPGYTLPAEINPKYFHKRGALAAARRGGSSNPEKRSSGSQFYIVQGFVHTQGRLDTMEMSMNSKAKNELLKEKFNESTEKLNEFRNNNDQAGFNNYVAGIRAEVDSIWETKPKVEFTPEQRESYTTIGGYPSLDGDYTVFGEVVEGLDVVEKISLLEADRYNRPVNDIKMEIELLK